MLKYFLPTTRYNHCDKNVETPDILQSFKLIENYIQEFEIIYGKEKMTFNLHSHLHFPEQVQK